MGQTEGVGRVSGAQVENEAEALEIGPQVLDVRVPVVELSVGAELSLNSEARL
jgi:hypothetical protein